MKYVAAYLLSSMGGNAQPSAKDLEKILGAAGLDVDMENANSVINALKGKSLEEVIASGQTKMASVPTGAPAAAAPAAVFNFIKILKFWINK
jgi:large subunit ribosomal protein LP2